MAGKIERGGCNYLSTDAGVGAAGMGWGGTGGEERWLQQMITDGAHQHSQSSLVLHSIPIMQCFSNSILLLVLDDYK